MVDRPEMISRQDWMLRTLVPLAAILCATALEIAMKSTQDERASLLVLLSCIWLIAWMFGLRAGLIATAVGAAAALYYVIPPAYSFRILTVSDGVQFGLFGAQGVLASVFCETRRRAIAATAEAETRERAARAEASSAALQFARSRQELKRARSDWTIAAEAVSRDLQARLGVMASSLGVAERSEHAAAWRLTEELLAYARACGVEQGTTALNMSDLWEEAIANCNRRYGRKFILNRGELPDVRGNEPALIQAFEYMAEAAMPFTPADRPIELSVTVGTMPGEWTFSVSDGEPASGTDQTQNPVTDIREPATTEAVLRLASCRRLLESQGGRIWTAGRIESGTSWVFSMPRLRS